MIIYTIVVVVHGNKRPLKKSFKISTTCDSDSFTTMAFSKFTYLLTYLLTYNFYFIGSVNIKFPLLLAAKQ